MNLLGLILVENSFDLIVLGAGSGGLAAAKRAASYGAKVAVVEGDRVGGTCVIRGCVPKKLLVYASLYGEYIENAKAFGIDLKDVNIDSSILLKNVRDEVDRLNNLHMQFLSKAGVTLVKGWGEFISPNKILVKRPGENAKNSELLADNILIAVGGTPNRPEIEGSSLGWISDDMFSLKSFPKNIVIVGGGFIACEFASILNGLGIKVTQLVRSNSLLRGFDSELSTCLSKEMESKGIDLHFGQEPIFIKGIKNDLKVITNSSKLIKCSGLLFATGRKACIKGLSLEKAGVEFNEKKIMVDKDHRTNVFNIFAIGDVTNKINLTPVAIDEGRSFADNIFGNNRRSVDYQLIPKAVFSNPEIATVGLSEEDAIEQFGLNRIKISRATFRSMSKALPKKGGKCLLKLIWETNNEKIVGCHMLGENSAEIIQMAGIALQMGAKKNDFKKTMALHPTISEEFVTMNF